MRPETTCAVQGSRSDPTGAHRHEAKGKIPRRIGSGTRARQRRLLIYVPHCFEGMMSKSSGFWFLLSRTLREVYVSRSRSRAGGDSKRKKRSGVCVCLERRNGRRKYEVLVGGSGREPVVSMVWKMDRSWSEGEARANFDFFFFLRGCGWWKGGQRHSGMSRGTFGRRAAKGGAAVASMSQGVENYAVGASGRAACLPVYEHR